MIADQHITVPRDADGARLDLFLCRHAPPGVTRGAVQRALRAGRVTIAGKRVIKPSTLVHEGQDIRLDPAAWAEGATVGGAAGPPPELRILHEDRQLAVIDKPAGVPVHRGVKPEPSIADALLARHPALAGVGESPERPGPPATLPPTSAKLWRVRAGIVHRLDKDTSGVLLVARTPEMYEYLKRQFLNRTVRKEYVALVHGVVPEDEGTVKLPIVRSKRNPLRRTVVVPRRGEPLDAARGKEAETSFRVLERFHEHTLLAVFPRTGRMHQIRVHLAHLGFPVAGDPLYGRKSRTRTPRRVPAGPRGEAPVPPMVRGEAARLSRQFLHARSITVALPSGKQRTFESPLPPDLASVLRALRRRATAPTEKPVTYRWRMPRSPRT